MPRHAIGLDFGTLSARALVVDLDSGETETFEHVYEHGVLESSSDPTITRQEPVDYVAAIEDLLKQAALIADQVVGIGVDATASTPIPVDSDLRPLSIAFPHNADAKAWLWKDHSAQAEADEITETMRATDPVRLARVGAYYAEWFWAKILRCSRLSPNVAAAAYTWLEQCDFITSTLTGNLKRGKCAAGHKALYFNGFPTSLPSELDRIAQTLGPADPCSEVSGIITEHWADRTGLPTNTPVAVGGVDAHLGAVGAGIGEGRLCLVLGTSACHMAVAPYEAGIRSIPGISGIADDSVLPGMLGLEAGQAAFGDLLDWAAASLGSDIDSLSKESSRAVPGCNGLMVLDFHAGNRCPLADARLSGVTLGQSLKTTRAESFRAVVEALAFGIRQIVEMFRTAGVPINDLIACGGVADKNDFVLQTIADVTGLAVYKSGNKETVALGAAIFGAVAGGAFSSAQEAQQSLCKASEETFTPDSAAGEVYNRLFPIWVDAQSSLGKNSDLLKRLADFREHSPH